MRTLLTRLVPLCAALLLFAGRLPSQPAFDSMSDLISPSIAAAQDAPKPAVDVDINVERGATVWYTDPTILLIGGGALLLLLVLIAAISRGGGGTTIIHEK